MPEIRDQCNEWGLDEAACSEKVIAVGIPPADPGANTIAGNSYCHRYNLTGVQVFKIMMIIFIFTLSGLRMI